MFTQEEKHTPIIRKKTKLKKNAHKIQTNLFYFIYFECFNDSNLFFESNNKNNT